MAASLFYLLGISKVPGDQRSRSFSKLLCTAPLALLCRAPAAAASLTAGLREAPGTVLPLRGETLPPPPSLAFPWAPHTDPGHPLPSAWPRGAAGSRTGAAPGPGSAIGRGGKTEMCQVLSQRINCVKTGLLRQGLPRDLSTAAGCARGEGRLHSRGEDYRERREIIVTAPALPAMGVSGRL